MAVKHISYKDLPPDMRKKGAAEARHRLSALLSHPFATAEQKNDTLKAMLNLDLWEKGALPETQAKPVVVKALPAPPSAAPAQAPVAHQVTIVESLTVAESD
jgi:hypothetical protein